MIENIFPYDIWDGHNVEGHLLIIPKKHTDTISSLSKQARMSLIDAIASYEAKGYSVYARASSNKTKSIVHQHTHLIKVGQKRKKLIVFLRKPHLLISR